MKPTVQEALNLLPEGEDLVHLVDAFGRELPSPEAEEFHRLLEDAFHSISADMRAEDNGWVRLAVSSKGGTNVTREHLIEQSRIYAKYDGNCRQIINLYTNFAVGTGFTWRTENTRMQNTITGYWRNPQNRRIFSSEGQRTTSKRVLVDGEVYFAHFGSGGGTITRRLNALHITDYIVDPQDEHRILGYRRKLVRPNGAVEYVHHADWTNPDLDGGVFKFATEGTEGVVVDGDYLPDNLVQRIVFDTDEHETGTPMLIASILWARVHRHFMRCRSAVMQTIAMFARKIKTKGGEGAVNRLLNAFSVTETQSNTIHSPLTPPGSTWIENSGVDLQPTSQETGAEAARVDGGMLTQMIGVGAGVFPHYLGSGESFRLATAGAMEPPMVRAFQSFQYTLVEEYYYLFEHILDSSEIRKNVDLDYPMVEIREMSKFIHALNETVNTYPKMKASDDMIMFTLTQLGVRNPAEVAEKIQALPDPMENQNTVSGPEEDIPAGNAQVANLPSTRNGADSR